MRPRYAILAIDDDGETEWLSEGDHLQNMHEEFQSLTGGRHIFVMILADTDFPELNDAE